MKMSDIHQLQIFSVFLFNCFQSTTTTDCLMQTNRDVIGYPLLNIIIITCFHGCTSKRNNWPVWVWTFQLDFLLVQFEQLEFPSRSESSQNQLRPPILSSFNKDFFYVALGDQWVRGIFYFAFQTFLLPVLCYCPYYFKELVSAAVVLNRETRECERWLFLAGFGFSCLSLCVCACRSAGPLEPRGTWECEAVTFIPVASPHHGEPLHRAKGSGPAELFLLSVFVLLIYSSSAPRRRAVWLHCERRAAPPPPSFSAQTQHFPHFLEPPLHQDHWVLQESETRFNRSSAVKQFKQFFAKPYYCLRFLVSLMSFEGFL